MFSFLLGFVSEAVLLSRYSFTADASDSVGGLTGTINGGVNFNSGQAQFSGASTFISLPNMFGSYSAVSIEVWASPSTGNIDWNRLLQFGQYQTNNNLNTFSINRNNYGAALGQFDFRYCDANSNCMDNYIGTTFAGSSNVHVVVTLAVGSYPQVYINGALASPGTTDAITGTVSNLLVSSIPITNFFYVGKSLETSTTHSLYGWVDELRIWGGVLSPQAVSFNYAMGPNYASKLM